MDEFIPAVFAMARMKRLGFYFQVVTNLKHSTIVRIILVYPVNIFVATVVLGSITKSSLL